MHAHMEFKEAGRVYEKVVEEKGVWETMSLKSDLKKKKKRKPNDGV